MTFHVEDPAALLDLVEEKDRAAAAALLAGSFTPGQLAMAAETWSLRGMDAPAFVEQALAGAAGEPNATFGEGYWTDHWTYSLDLIENYLAVWPERKDSLLFGAADYPWYEIRARVLPRAERAAQPENGLRQVRFLEKRETPNRWMREDYGTGPKAQSSLIEKMVLLCAVKYAARDRAGIGLEMEAGKPGWYDALNGLPGIFGSSVADVIVLCQTPVILPRSQTQYICSTSLYLVHSICKVKTCDVAKGTQIRIYIQQTFLRTHLDDSICYP
jgi:hypothetical protein